MKHDIQTLCHEKAGVPAHQNVYRNVAGEPVLIANRYDKSNGGKFFLPYDMLRKEWKAPVTRPIYNLDKIAAADPATPIILAEGEKCADALSQLGFLVTTTFGGSNGSAKADLSPLTGRAIIIWPDFDDPGQKYASAIATALRERHATTAKIIPITPDTLCSVMNAGEPVAETLCKGWDAADAILEGWGRKEIEKLLSLAVPYVARPAQKNGKVTAAPDLGIVELWHCENQEPYATIQKAGHFEHLPINSTKFKDLLSYSHYVAEGKIQSAPVLEDKRRALTGEARFEGNTYKVFNRIGTQGPALYLDLGDEDWRAAAIDAGGWQILERPPVHFTRSRSMQPLPMPVSGTGDITLLRPFLNTSSGTDFKMLVAWLIGCFHPKGPYPILILTGEQGSAKSTTAKVLRSLVDPANPMGRSSPQTEQDLVIAAKHNHVLAFDNLSHIKPAIADALCRISTGGGFGTRKLHTDSEEVLFDSTRPCILNGIPDLASRADLADRAVIVTLPVITNTSRQTETEFWKAFDIAAPAILAGLLDTVSTAISRIGSVTLSESPRMADFAKWITAAEPALGWPDGAFMQAYAANRLSVEEAAIEGNPVAEAILCLIEDQGTWRGTATELIKTLRAGYSILTDDPASFPRQPNKLAGELRRVAPLLRSRGVIIAFERQGKSGRKVITVGKA